MAPVQEVYFGPSSDFSHLYFDYMFDLLVACIAHIHSDFSMHFGIHQTSHG
jgi:hypothetical protein